MRALAAAVRGTIRYEFLMAVRRRVLWLASVPLLALAALVCLTSPRIDALATTAGRAGAWTVIVNMFAVAGLGVVLADRFVRTHRFGLAEVLAATPTTLAGRMLGVLVGSLGAGLLPAAVLVVVLMPLALLRRPGDLLAGAGWGLLAFLIAVVPAAILMTVFAATAGLVLPVPVARILAVLVWFWSTLFSTRLIPLPSPTGTLLSPLGDYAIAGWLHGPVLWAGRGSPGALSPPVSAGAAVLNVAVILLLTALLFAVARWAAARRP